MIEDTYDINAYTDKELYEILDLMNPTDRELEAKILMMMDKYKSINNEKSRKLYKFFYNAYIFLVQNRCN